MTKQLILSIGIILSCLNVYPNPSGKDYIYTRRNKPLTDSVGLGSHPVAVTASDHISASDSTSRRKHFSFGEVKNWCRQNHVADNLSVGVTAGTGGLGIELATPITSRVRLRTGVEWIPSFTLPLSFDLSSFSESGESNDVSHIQEMVKDLMGLDMDDRVVMDAKPHLLNYKLLVDVFPFRNNRHWHFTAGFYLGSPVVGKAKNNRSEKQTLVGVNLYNRAYNYFTSPDFDPYMVSIGNGFYLDPELAEEYREKFERYGRVGIHIGNFKNGTPYLMEPTKDGNVSAKAVTNNFRPYLGFGYSGFADRNKRIEIGFEAGALFWGGSPKVYLHDGVNLTKDLVDIRGKVGDYVDVLKALPVYPLVNFKISYTLF